MKKAQIYSYIKRNIDIIFLFTVSLVVLGITSKNSPLYPLNDWGDANSFFTIGKGMFNGLIPYRDLFDHKGPVLYLIYGLGYLITNKSFLGVFLLELIFFTVFLCYAKKMVLLFTSDKKALYFFLPIFAVLLCTIPAFAHGGSAEEFMLPLLMISLYHFVNFLKNDIINKKIILTDGIIFGIVFLTKFTLCGLWVAYMLFLFMEMLIRKQAKEGIIYPLVFIGGALIPFIGFSIYFVIHNAFYDFIYTYFYLNIFSYGQLGSSILGKITAIGKAITFNLIASNFIVLLMFLYSLIVLIKIALKKRYKVYLFNTLLLMALFMFFGGQLHIYYSLNLYIFLVFIPAYPILKLKSINYIYPCFIVALLIYTYHNANYSKMIGLKKSEMVQYKFANIINGYDDATILTYGFIDTGFYLATNKIPKQKYFTMTNIESLEESQDEQNRYIADKEIDFIICLNKENIADYVLIETIHHDDARFYYLYIKKETLR